MGWDLCVLATSRHSVHTYGTFGMWGSLLAGGEAVVARGRVQVSGDMVTMVRILTHDPIVSRAGG